MPPPPALLFNFLTQHQACAFVKRVVKTSHRQHKFHSLSRPEFYAGRILLRLRQPDLLGIQQISRHFIQVALYISPSILGSARISPSPCCPLQPILPTATPISPSTLAQNLASSAPNLPWRTSLTLLHPRPPQPPISATNSFHRLPLIPDALFLAAPSAPLRHPHTRPAAPTSDASPQNPLPDASSLVST